MYTSTKPSAENQLEGRSVGPPCVVEGQSPSRSGSGSGSNSIPPKVIRYEDRINEWITLGQLDDLAGSRGTGSGVILSNIKRCIIDLRPLLPPSRSQTDPTISVSRSDTNQDDGERDEDSLTGGGVTITSIHIKGLEGCILLADVEGSIMCSEVHNSLLVLKSHQVSQVSPSLPPLPLGF